MKRRLFPILCLSLFAILGCQRSTWRSSALEDLSIGDSKVFHLQTIRFADRYTIEKFRLSNGLKIIVMEDHASPVFAYHTWFGVGSRNEREGITGMAHLFEHLMFKETTNTKEGEFDRIMESNGGKINAGTSRDYTFYTNILPKEAFDIVPKLEADRLENMVLNKKQVNSEREVVANERRLRVDNSPSGKLSEAMNKVAFKEHPYRWPVIGWMKDILSMSTEECIKFHGTFYAPNNATVVVVGDLKTNHVLKKINEFYGHLKPSKLPDLKLPPDPPQKKERRTQIASPTGTERMRLAHRIPDINHPDNAALEIASSILTDGRSSRLRRLLVTEKELASSISGHVGSGIDPGLFVISSTMRPGVSSKKVEKLILDELNRMKLEKVTQNEIDRALNKIETGFWGFFKTAKYKAFSLGYYETVTGDFRRLFNELPSYRNVTPEDIRRIARKYFRKNQRTVAISKPKKEKP